jgi:hypothetical protein
VTVAVALLATASLAVLFALPAQSAGWLSLAAVLAVVLGWAAARIVYTELVQSRRHAAADRAAQAQAYKELFHARAAEHAEFTSAMTDRLVARDREIRSLRGDVRVTEIRAKQAEQRVRRESRRALDALEQVSLLRARVSLLEVRKAEAADELASWGGGTTGQDSVADLVAWEEKAVAGRPTVGESHEKQA